MDYLQRQRMRDAVALSGLTVAQVWLHYFGNGGAAREARINLFLVGGAVMPEMERDILAHAINELLWDRNLASMVPYSSPLASAKELANGPQINAAAASLLADDEAEAERFRSLTATGLLHSGPDPDLDALMVEARDAFDVSSASVSLIGSEHQYLKASRGSVPQPLPRREPFCDEAIRTADPLLIPDTHTDERFRDHPLVVGEPFLRFYAAHPLRGPGGWNIGTFCITDQRPHSFSASERSGFRSMARRAEQQIGRAGRSDQVRHADSN